MTAILATSTDAEIAAAIAESDAEYLRPQFCSVVDGDCLNPAGYGVSGGGSCGNSDGPRTRARCGSCGEPVCAACRTGQRGRWTCNSCTDREAWLVKRAQEAAADAIKAAIHNA